MGKIEIGRNILGTPRLSEQELAEGTKCLSCEVEFHFMHQRLKSKKYILHAGAIQHSINSIIEIIQYSIHRVNILCETFSKLFLTNTLSNISQKFPFIALTMNK